MSSSSRSASGTPAGSTAKKKAAEEEKRKQIKEIIEKIPSDKSALFSFKLEWDLLDLVCILIPSNLCLLFIV